MVTGRQGVLKNIYTVYTQYKVPLVGGSLGKFFPGVYSDDLGTYLYVPIIADWFNLDTLLAAYYFFLSLACVFIFLSLSALFSINKNWAGRAIVFLLFIPFFLKIITFSDSYSAYIFSLSPTLPLLASINKQSKKYFIGTFLLAGFVAIVSHILRKYSCLPLLLFLLVILVFEPLFKRKIKLYALLAFLAGASVPYAHFLYSLHQQSVFLTTHGYSNIDLDPGYGIWHTVYLGFGFTQNKYGIVRQDACAYEAAKKVDSTVTTPGKPKCEKIMKNIVFNLIKKDRHFVLTSFFARFGIAVMFFLLWFGWLGVVISYYYPKPWYHDFAWIVALSGGLVPGILAFPAFQYLAGFITCTFLYTLYSLSYACNRGMLSDIIISIKRYYH
jgi:hypothetical protein